MPEQRNMVELFNSFVNVQEMMVGPDDLAGQVIEAMKTCCVRCDIRKTCEYAFDPYNVGSEPKTDCLAAK